MPRMCPECHEPRMTLQTFTCDDCWSGMTSQRRDMYQSGRLPEKSDAGQGAGMGEADFRRIAEVMQCARKRVKYGTEAEFLSALMGDLVHTFLSHYPARVFNPDAFIAECGGLMDQQTDEERARQRGEFMPDPMPVGIFDDGPVNPAPSPVRRRFPMPYQWATEMPVTIGPATDVIEPAIYPRAIAEAMRTLLTPVTPSTAPIGATGATQRRRLRPVFDPNA